MNLESSSFFRLLWAEFRRATGRRAVRGLLVLALAIEVLVFWGNFYEVKNLRSSLAFEQSNREAIAQLDAPDPNDVQVLQEVHEQNQKTLSNLRTYLAARYVHQFSLGFWGTLPGIFMSVLLAGTLFGADFRWDYWKMLALQEPRRARVILAKLLILAPLIGFGLFVLLAASYGLNEFFLNMHDFQVQPTPLRFMEVAGWIGRAFVTTYAYGAVSAAIVIALGSALAGSGGGLGLVFLDTFLQRVLSGGSSMFTQYVFTLSPAQQVANLFVGNPSVSMYGRVWFLPPQAVRLAPVHTPALHLEVIPPSAWQAAALLMVVFGIAAIVAVVVVRTKEF